VLLPQAGPEVPVPPAGSTIAYAAARQGWILWSRHTLPPCRSRSPNAGPTATNSSVWHRISSVVAQGDGDQVVAVQGTWPTGAILGGPHLPPSPEEERQVGRFGAELMTAGVLRRPGEGQAQKRRPDRSTNYLFRCGGSFVVVCARLR
jgi:hypothetical protein